MKGKLDIPDYRERHILAQVTHAVTQNDSSRNLTAQQPSRSDDFQWFAIRKL